MVLSLVCSAVELVVGNYYFALEMGCRFLVYGLWGLG